MRDYPAMIDHTGVVEPVPRRIRGYLGTRLVFDTIAARYVWDTPKYPAYHIPVADVDVTWLQAGAAQVFGADADEAVSDTVRIGWDELDAWFEEDEQVYVHPRNPYTRVDALRSSRTVTVALAGETLAQSSATVMVFETGLPTRYYVDRTDVAFGWLEPSATRTECPYKGRTSDYWSATVGDLTVTDIAWSYAFPTRALSPIAGMVAFYNEHADITVDGVLQPRPEPGPR